jgi:hypothetical protein
MDEGTQELAEDVLRGREMGLTGVVHVEAQLLDCVWNARLGKGEELESSGLAVVGSLVADGGAHVEGDLGLSVDRHGAGIAVIHASALKNVLSVLALVKEEAVRLLLHRGIEEVVEVVEVLHGEMLLESCSGMLEKLRTRGGEDDVVNVEQQVSNVGVAAVDDQVGGKTVVLGSLRLRQAVEGLIEPTHWGWAGSTKLACWEQ